MLEDHFIVTREISEDVSRDYKSVYTSVVKAGGDSSRELIKRLGILTIALGYAGSGNGKRHARSENRQSSFIYAFPR